MAEPIASRSRSSSPKSRSRGQVPTSRGHFSNIINTSIIQWNCRGAKANFVEVQRLVMILNPFAFCLQETHLTPNSSLSLKKFLSFNAYGPNLHRPSGGSTILVRHDIIHRQVPIDTNLQAVAVRLTLHKAITLFYLYTSRHTSNTSRFK